MKLTFELTAEQAESLRRHADRLGVAPEELARAVVSDLIASKDDHFKATLARVLDKNRELYERLS